MKTYSKLLETIKNTKTRVKNGISIISFAVGLGYCRINSIPTNLSSNSTQQVEQLHNYVEENMQVINTKDAKSFKTGSGAVIAVRRLIPPSEALKYTLEIRSGSIEGVEGLPADGFGINPPISQLNSSQSFTS